MDVVVTGRHCQISDSFRDQVAGRLAAIEKLRDRLIRAEVMLTVSENKRQPDQAARVEITLVGKGPVVRAEASSDDKVVAFEHALDRLKSQLRKAADRRKVHRGLRGAASIRTAEPTAFDEETQVEEGPVVRTMAGLEVHGDGPLVVREKNFEATPLTSPRPRRDGTRGPRLLLYVDADTARPSVVYRRKAYDFGVIHLMLDA
jgi:ribosomal subunit interface protein